MAVVYDHACLVSTLKNNSGGTKKFGFIPPHGKELEDQEEINVFGQITEAVNRGDRFGNRNMNAFLDSLDAGDIVLQSTPLPIGFAETADDSKVIGVNTNGTDVELTDPCWETSLSEVP